jgi:hypothetical protein
MNIVPTTRTVVDYACTFSEQDIQLARDDPYSFGEKFREQLLALDPKPEPNSNGKHPNRVHITLSRRGRKGAGKQTARKAAPKAQKTLLQCPQCPKQFKTHGRLNNHLADVHGEAASASTNTWQKADAPAAES